MVYHIVGDAWKRLHHSKITDRTIDILWAGNIPPYDNPPLFTGANTIFVRKCDKNFVYYWLRRRYFPKVETIYLDSHPSSLNIFHEFGDNTTMFVSHQYDEYIKRWAKDKSNVVGIKSERITDILETYEYEDLD